MDHEPEQTPVDLVIRFTASVPDVVLTIPRPASTSTLSLKQLIRPHLPANLATSRLRLISAGKVLPDTKAISDSISIPPQPPCTAPTPESPSSKSKGKARLPPPPHARVYIHCSIADPLSATDLASEPTQASEADAALVLAAPPAPRSNAGAAAAAAAAAATAGAAAATAPRGFDRLLASGFGADEVATLRTQFLAIQAHTHTPDTMPSGDALRALEDRWLDGDAGGGGGGGAGGAGGEADGAEDGGLEDMLWGNIMGFFWPVAAVCWLMREEGVWSRRRQIAVLSGMLVNVTFGFLRLTS